MGAGSLFKTQGEEAAKPTGARIIPIGLGLLFEPPTLSLRYKEEGSGKTVTKHFQIKLEPEALRQIQNRRQMDERAEILQRKYEEYLCNVPVDQIFKLLTKLREEVVGPLDPTTPPTTRMTERCRVDDDDRTEGNRPSPVVEDVYEDRWVFRPHRIGWFLKKNVLISCVSCGNGFTIVVDTFGKVLP